MNRELTVADLDQVSGGDQATTILTGILAGTGFVQGAMQGFNRGMAEAVGKAAAAVANHPPT